MKDEQAAQKILKLTILFITMYKCSLILFCFVHKPSKIPWSPSLLLLCMCMQSEVVNTVVPHLYGPQLYGSPDYTDPILHQINDIHGIIDVH